MTPEEDAERRRKYDDELAQLLNVLRVGRRWSIIRYMLIVAVGVASLFAPSTVLLTQTTNTATLICSLLWTGCGLTCLVSVLRDRRTGEFFGIPGLIGGLTLWAAALMIQAFTVTPVTVPYGLALLALAASLKKRETEVRALMTVSDQFGGPHGGS